MSDLVARFADVCRDDPARPLLHLPASGRTLTASNIWEAHRTSADALERAGVGSGHLVVSAAGNTPSAPALLLACRTLGAVMMPVDACATPAEVAALSARFGAAAIVTGSGEIRAIGRDVRRYDDAAVLKLTSGSTGAAKATRTSEAQLAADCAHIVAAMDIRAGDTQIAAIPMSHSYGLGNLLLPLLLQGTACVLRDSFVPQLVPDDARRFGARVFPAVPFMFEYFLANPPPGGWPPTLQRLISAGAPLSPATIRAFHDRFAVKIHSFYGSSETGGISFDDADDVRDVGSVGRLLPGVVVTLRNAECGMRNDEDELRIHEQSAINPQSAIRNPQSTRRIHVVSEAVSSGYADGDPGDFVDGGFLTGDCGEWDRRGRLRLAGRVSSFVNVAGRKVDPAEVEAVLRAMPGVADVRVVAAPDARRGQQIVACVVAAGGEVSPVTTLGVRRFCAERLASYKVPRAIVFVERIPISARGKTDRAALDALVARALGRSSV